MAKKIDIATLRELLRYDAGSGKLWWRTRRRKWFKSDHDWRSWNTRFANTLALNSRAKSGYLYGSILYQDVYAHRVAFAMVHGYWPPEVDHRNGKRRDNSKRNLRRASRLQNSRNKALRNDNRSGVHGVGWVAKKGYWVAQITVNGRTKHIGCFKHFGEAKSARKAAEVGCGFYVNHGRDGAEHGQN